jgi:hypothetical protein
LPSTYHLLEAQAKLAAKEAKEKRKLAKQSSQVKRPSEPQRIDYDYEMVSIE